MNPPSSSASQSSSEHANSPRDASNLEPSGIHVALDSDELAHYQRELGLLRDRIDAIDTQLVNLLAQRSQEVERVVALKKAHHQPVYHPAREEDLIFRRRQQAAARGMNPDFVEDVFRRMLRESRMTQSERMLGHGLVPGARVVLVGGGGGMGQCLARWFSSGGYEVRVLERNDWPDAPKICEGAKLCVLAVPIAVTGWAAREIARHIPPTCVLADITSIKAAPLSAMLQAHNGPVLGMHPMFGPTTHTLDKQIVVVSEGRHPEQYQWVLDQLTTWGAVVMPASAEEHDEAMAIVQALRHFATFCFGQFLYRRRVNLRQTLDFSSPIYRLELAMVGRLFAQDPHLYAEIIFSTPERLTILKDYVASINESLPMLEQVDKERFVTQFQHVAEWFGPFADQAIRESTFLIEKLIERF